MQSPLQPQSLPQMLPEMLGQTPFQTKFPTPLQSQSHDQFHIPSQVPTQMQFEMLSQIQDHRSYQLPFQMPLQNIDKKHFRHLLCKVLEKLDEDFERERSRMEYNGYQFEDEVNALRCSAWENDTEILKSFDETCSYVNNFRR